MSMQDFAAALGGGGAPGAAPPDMGAGPPGLGGPPPDAGGSPLDGGQPSPDAGPPGGGADFTNSLEALDAAEEALKSFIDLDPDHGDKAVAAQCLQNVLKLKASNQDSAQSGDMKSLARALQGGPGATAGPIGQVAGGGY